MAKIKSFGTRVYIGPTLVGGLKSVELPETEVTDIDLTTHNSASEYREFAGGLKDGGTATLGGAYDIADAGQTILRDDDVQGQIRYVTVIFSDGSRVAFNAVVKGYGVSNPLDEDVTFSSSLKITGEVSYSKSPVFLTVTGITTPSGASDLNLELLSESGTRPDWTDGQFVAFYDDDPSELKWVIWNEEGVDPTYHATKASTAATPIGLTGWTIIAGAGQPVITAFPAL